jgi:hypothetical protein
LSLLFRSVYVVNLVLEWQCQAPRSQRHFLRLLQSAIGFIKRRQFSTCPFFTFITYLAALDAISFVLGSQSNSRPALQASAARLALQSAKRLILIPNAIYFDYHFSAPTALMGPF